MCSAGPTLVTQDGGQLSMVSLTMSCDLSPLVAHVGDQGDEPLPGEEDDGVQPSTLYGVLVSTGLTLE